MSVANSSRSIPPTVSNSAADAASGGGRGEVEDDVVGWKIEARGVVRIEEKGAPLRHDVPQAVGQHLHVVDTRRVRTIVDDGEDVGRIRDPGKAAGAHRDVRVQIVDGRDRPRGRERLHHAIDDAALEEACGEGLADFQRLIT